MAPKRPKQNTVFVLSRTVRPTMGPYRDHLLKPSIRNGRIARDHVEHASKTSWSSSQASSPRNATRQRTVSCWMLQTTLPSPCMVVSNATCLNRDWSWISGGLPSARLTGLGGCRHRGHPANIVGLNGGSSPTRFVRRAGSPTRSNSDPVSDCLHGKLPCLHRMLLHLANVPRVTAPRPHGGLDSR